MKKFLLPIILSTFVASAFSQQHSFKMAAQQLKVEHLPLLNKTDKKFVGPNPTGVTERRTPEWIMNMIMNPENMILEDPTAIALLAEYNGAPMANQNIAEADARAILEYFRTLK